MRWRASAKLLNGIPIDEDDFFASASWLSTCCRFCRIAKVACAKNDVSSMKRALCRMWLVMISDDFRKRRAIAGLHGQRRW